MARARVTFGLAAGLLAGVAAVFLLSGTTTTPEWSTPFVVYPPNSSCSAFYPRFIQLPDGAILASYDVKRPGLPTSLELSRSTDGGRTWRRVGTIRRSSLNVANGHLALYKGVLYCSYREVGNGTYRIGLSKSSDGGLTWTYVCTIRSGHRGLWEPFLLPVADRLMVFYSSEEKSPRLPQTIDVQESRDGTHWSQPRTAVSSPTSRDGMPSLVVSEVGDLLMVFESTEEGRFALSFATSSDGGRTWSRRVLYRARDKRSASAPYICRIRSGRYAVSFQTDEDSESPGIVGHASAKVLVIGEGGRRIAGPWTVFEGGSVWNSLLVLSDGRILFGTSTTQPGFSQVLVRLAEGI